VPQHEPVLAHASTEPELDTKTDDFAVDADAPALEASAFAAPEEEAPKKKPRQRQNFTWRQMMLLEQVFETDPLPRQALVNEIANHLQITPRCVQVWFQNRRQKWKTMHLNMGKEPPPLKNQLRSRFETNLDQLLPTLNAVERIANSIVVQNPPVEAANHALMPPTNDAVAMQVSEQNSAPNHDMQTPGYGQVVMTQTGALLLVTPQGCIPYTPSIVQVAEQPAPEISDATEADKEITAEVDHSIPTATSN